VDGDVAGVPRVIVRRSARRRRTVSAHREGDAVVVLLPARLSVAEEQRWVQEMLAKLQRSEARRRPAAGRSDAELARRAAELSQRWLAGRARPAVVRWVPPMRTRWASCTPAEASIRISERLREMPDWVVDYVIVHELAHLLEPGHGPAFWAWVQRYPKTERAMGYLQGVSAAAHLDMDPMDEGSDDVDVPS
jgi:predicted metal-dependent hydrolase